jgi:hypothetical protein
MSSPGRWTLVLGILITVTALAAGGCCSIRCEPTARLVIVREAETRDGYHVTVISKSKHQQIVWKLSHGSPYTKVAIKLGENIEPFVNCETTAGICSIPGEHGLCFSGSINPLLVVPPPRSYDYDFSNGSVTSTDPGIRIDP